VEIVGLNRSVFSTSVASLAMMTNGRLMPWLRCSPMGGVNDPSTSWALPNGAGGTRPPFDRELVVLNHRNEFILSFNLTANPIDGLSRATERARVRDSLRAAAELADTDGDRLPDDWELDEFDSLDAVTADSPTASGLSALLAYALGQSPHAATPTMGLHLTRTDHGYQLSYTRRLARRPALLWSIERSQGLSAWHVWTDTTGASQTAQYDGTATERVIVPLATDQPGLESYRLRLNLGMDPAP